MSEESIREAGSKHRVGTASQSHRLRVKIWVTFMSFYQLQFVPLVPEIWNEMLTQWRCLYSLPSLISLNCIKCLLTRKDPIPCRTDWSDSWLWESVMRLSHSLAAIPSLQQKSGLRFKPHMKTSKEQRPDPLHQLPWLQDRRAAGFCPRAERSASLYQMNGLLLWPWGLRTEKHQMLST